ncbi:MAG: hypothetical protein Q4Q07_04580 [Tissierellia bacterium]|nr:hypothetical protein [Tissierellia bacterium]
MRVCTYCGSENSDDVLRCTSCGANEFNNKCNNCGTVFSEGNYCTKCGVKAGTVAKVCPKCEKEYFSAACPDCGYTVHEKDRTGFSYESETVVTVGSSTIGILDSVDYTAGRTKRDGDAETTKQEEKSNTWLWVLGWIFCFPIPLTILLVRSEKAREMALWVLGWMVIYPLPLTILMRRKKNMSDLLRYAIIIFAWSSYIVILATSPSTLSS